MASKKSSSTKSTKSTGKATPKATSTPVRNTPIPKISAAPAFVAAPVAIEVGADLIAVRAYEIWTTRGGTEEENWLLAESELRAA